MLGAIKYLATLVKSFLLIEILGDILQFCYILAVDAWRPNAFEAYRRALCGASWAEITEGKLYASGQPRPFGNCRTVIDLLIQIVIYLSF